MTPSHSEYPQRVSNTLRFREFTVMRTERISVGFQRIVLGGEALEGFSSLGFDDHTKVFFPEPGRRCEPPAVTDEGIIWANDVRPVSRDYTALYDEERHELMLDFFIHDGGVASRWAQEVSLGDTLLIGGPRGSLVVPLSYQFQLYVCDESGMTALRRQLEALRALAERPQIKSIVSLGDAASKDYLAHVDDFDIEWMIGHNPQALAECVAKIDVPPQDYFLWITGEGNVVK